MSVLIYMVNIGSGCSRDFYLNLMNYGNIFNFTVWGAIQSILSP